MREAAHLLSEKVEAAEAETSYMLQQAQEAERALHGVLREKERTEHEKESFARQAQEAMDCALR